MTEWSEYFEITKDKPPRPLLVKALNFVKEKNTALDLGAGSLNDSEYLLEQEFKKVTAVDSDPLVLQFAKEINNSNLTCIVSTFDKFNFPSSEYDLVSAQFSLPFNPLRTFEEVFFKIKASLKKGGIFTGQLFGVRDTWNDNSGKMTFHTQKQAEKLFSNMEVLHFVEDERDNKTALGQQKHWHIFHFIVKKI